MVRPKAKPSKGLVLRPDIIAGGEWLSLEPPFAFVCSYCARAFPSTQALGGHQNAHRKEKKDKKKRLAKAKNALQGMSMISPQPLGMIYPSLPSSLALQNGPFLPVHFPQYPLNHHPAGFVLMQQGQPRNHKGKGIMIFQEGRKKRGPRGEAPRGQPHKNARSNGLARQSSSIGSSSGLINDLDLELRL
ncbi:zinc finger protein KNUCKLES-like [Punica granatum]|uniref:C2H2-type domain-containing protein n=2 Tax=Punica granatum TaxID=22663 RepID=A0A218XDS9_PUNGR|nr:zinc finger protein KNUCKLES-like [Punica granatum]OWM82641.1 hypothetical protein CDL15_Pgr002216 [Punica granatum]PKI54168.1 hypothetical protein CRG98_025401 [Punica granatum]